MRPPILVTGAAGFIGFHTCLRLLEQGRHVIGLDNLNDYYDVTLKEKRLALLFDHSQFSFHKIDLADKDAIFSLFDQYSFQQVINLAAQAGVRYSLTHPQAYIDSNITGFVNILEACRRFPIEHLVYASSSSVYGSNTDMPFSVSQNVDHPVSLYAATKKSNELLAHTYSHLYNIPTTGLRFFTVYGPWGRPDMAYFSFTHAIMADKPINVFNYGKMKRDFTYIDDVTDGIVRISEKIPQANSLQEAPGSSHAPYCIYNVGNDKPEELGTLITLLENALGKKAEKNLMPMQDGDVEATWADIDTFREACGYQPKTSLKEGIEKFVAWYQEYTQNTISVK